MPKTSNIRIFVDIKDLKTGQVVELGKEQAHYLLSVMRLEDGAKISVFNGISGEFDCRLIINGKKTASLQIVDKTKDFKTVPDIWLLFAPLKKDNTDFVVEKSTELGVSAIFPVITEYTISDKVKTQRWKAQSIEAAEQSRRLDVPEIFEPLSLKEVLSKWDKKRKLFFMDETGAGSSFFQKTNQMTEPLAFLIGPEGGFSVQELETLRACPFAHAISLGPRILRAETAAIASLACWQAIKGDWQ